MEKNQFKLTFLCKNTLTGYTLGAGYTLAAHCRCSWMWPSLTSVSVHFETQKQILVRVKKVLKHRNNPKQKFSIFTKQTATQTKQYLFNSF
jgi:hypothetical protein